MSLSQVVSRTVKALNFPRKLKRRRKERRIVPMQVNVDYFQKSFNSTNLFSSHLSKLEMSQYEGPSLLEIVPKEIIISILSFLEPKHLFNVELVCIELHHLVRDNYLWFILSKKHFNVTQYQKADWRAYFAMKWCIKKKGSMKWVEPSKIKLPSERSRHTGNVIGDDIVFIGGNDLSGEPIRQITYLNTRNSEFQKKSVLGDMPPIGRHSSCIIDGKIWIFGGSITPQGGERHKHNRLAIYDPENCIWTWVSPKGDAIPEPRSDHAGVSIGKKIYIFGGSNLDVQPLNDLWEFDVETSEWTELSPFTKGTSPYPRSGHSMTVIDKKIFVYGGAVWSTTSRWQKHSNDMFIFDTETLTWEKPVISGPCPNVSTFSMLLTLGKTIWVVGGGSKYNPVVLSEIRVLDTLNWTWTANRCNLSDLKSIEVINELQSRNIDFRSASQQSLLKRLEEIIQKEDNYIEIGGFPMSPRGCLSGGIVDSFIYFFGGFCGAPLNDLKVLDLSWKRKLEKCGIYIDRI